MVGRCSQKSSVVVAGLPSSPIAIGANDDVVSPSELPRDRLGDGAPSDGQHMIDPRSPGEGFRQRHEQAGHAPTSPRPPRLSSRSRPAAIVNWATRSPPLRRWARQASVAFARREGGVRPDLVVGVGDASRRCSLAPPAACRADSAPIAAIRAEPGSAGSPAISTISPADRGSSMTPRRSSRRARCLSPPVACNRASARSVTSRSDTAQWRSVRCACMVSIPPVTSMSSSGDTAAEHDVRPQPPRRMTAQQLI